MSHRGARGGWAAVLGSLLLVGGALVGCSSQQSPMSPQDATSPGPDADPNPQIAAMHIGGWIGAGGGVLEIGPYSLSFPPNALPVDTFIEIQQLNVREWPIELSPHAVQFERPVTLRMDVQGEQDPESLQIHWWNDETSQWEAQLSKMSRGVVSTQLWHFSRYTLD